MANRALAIKKVKAYVQNPELIKAPSMAEMADLVVLVLSAVQQIEEAIQAGRLDGKTPVPDQDYLSLDTAERALNAKVREMLTKTDETLSQTSQALQERVAEAIQNLRDGKDGIVSDEEIQRAAEVALGMLDLPDFDLLVTEAITANSNAIRDALELLSGDDRYKVEIADVIGLQQMLDDIALIRGNSGGGLGKRQVFDFIREAIANGIIVSSGVTDGDKGDVTVSGAGTVWTIDDDTIGLDELSATGTPDGTKFLRGDNVWAVPPGSSGGITRSVANINTPTTAGATAVTDYVFNVTNTTLTLPTAVGNTNQYTVKCISGTCVVEGDAAETIEGGLNITIQVEDSVDLISNNTEWKVV